MNNKERDEKFLKSWLKKKISITTSTVVSFLITGAIGGGAAYGAGNKPGTGGNNNSVAWGQGSSVDNDSVAVGANASAVSASGGNNPTVTSKGVAIGNNAKAEGSVSIGDSASSTHFGVAVGYKAGVQNTTTGASFSNVTIGANTRVGVQGTQAAQGIAIGSGIQAHEGAWAKGDQSISIGANTTASGDSSIAIGGDDLLSVSAKTSSYSDAKFDKNGNKIGGNSNNTASINNIFNTLTGRGTILHQGIGTDGKFYTAWRNTESGQGGVALGVKSISGDIALAIGTFSEAKGTNSVAIGTGAQTPQSGAVAIGGGSTTYGLQGRQITDADITLTDGTTMALTNFAGASGVLEGSMVSFGKAGNERQLKHIAPGEVSATSTDGINGSQLFAVAKKLGDDISKFKYVSIKSNDAGNKLNDGATANNAIAIGPNASTKVESAVSLGDGANVLPGPTKDKAGTLLQTVISSGSGVAIGKNATATQAGVAIGDTSSTVTSGIAIGREAKVTNKYEAASGPYVVGDSQDGYLNYDRVQNPDNLQYSKTEATGNNIFSPDRYNGQGIAIGYKAESNMFGTSLGNSAVAKQGGLALGTFSRAEGATATAIGLGANSSGARGISMGRQASATTADSVAIGTGARGGATSAGGSVAIGGGAAATGTQAIAIGGLYGNDLYSSSATKDGAGNLTKNTQASGAGSIAMGVNAVANKDNALALGGSTQVFKNEDVALGYGSKVTSAPTSVTSATVGGVTYGGFAGTNPNSSLSIGSAGNERQIKNVAAGEISATSTDAINGSQLYSVANKLSQGWTATADGNKIGAATPTAVKPGNTVVYSAGSNLQVKQTIDATNGKQTYEYSLNKDLTGLDSVTTKKLTVPGTGGKDTVIDNNGINAGNNKITNVAPGVNGTDAVNKNQLDQKIGDNTIKLGGDKGTTGTQNLSQATGLQFNIKGGDGLETSASGTDVTVQLDTVTKQKLNKAVLPLKFSGDDYDPFDEVSTVVSKELGQKLEIVGGADTTDPTKLSNNNIGTMVDGTGKINIKLAKELKDLTSAEFKTPAGNKTVINGDGLTITPSAPGATPISVTKDGINAGDKKVTNVAPGTISATSKDAINGSQFHGLAKNTIQLGGDKGTTTDTQTLDKTGGIKFDIVGANGITTEAKDGKVTVSVDPSKLSASNSKLSYTANGDTTKQEVKLSDGLNFTDGKLTTASVAANGVVKYDVKTTTLTSTDGKVTVPTTDGVATAKDVANAINNSGWKANAGGNVDGTSASTLVKSGDEVVFKAGDNLTVKQDLTAGKQEYTYKLNKDLTGLDSVTSKTITVPGAPGTNDVVIGKDGISAGNKVIKDVAPGVNGTDAVNKNQLDQKIGDNKIKLGGDTGTTATQDLSQAGGLQFNIKGANGIETSAAGTDVTVKLDAATRGKIDNAADKNLSNLTPAGIDKIKDTAAWKVKANSNAAETVKGGDEVVFKDGAGVTITQNGKEFTIAADTSKISKDTKISYTANGAAPKKEVSLADGFNFEDGTLTTASVDTAGKVKYDVKTTTLTSTDGKVNTPAANNLVTANDVANAINNAGWKANAGGNVDGTSTSTLVKAGDEVVFKAGDNLTVKQDLTAGKQEYTYKLNKDLTGLDSVTSKTITVPGAPGTNDVVIGKDGISAGNKVIKDVAPGVNGTDAVNKNQLDQKIGDNKIKLGGDTGTTATQDLSQAGGLQFNIKGANGIETSAAGTDVTVKLDAATRGKIDNAADKNLSNLTPAGIDKIKDTAAWKVKANSNAAETVKGGDEVVFKDGAGVTITQNGKEFTIAADTSKISKDTKISYTANGDAPKKEVSLADGFNFENGTLTTASVDTAGKVKYDVKTSALTSTPDGKVTVPTTDGVATAKDVANAINNSGWKANAGGNVDGTPASTLVKSGDEVVFKAGDNLTVKQDLSAGKQEYTYKLNKDLTGLDSVTTKTITIPGAPGTNDVVIGKDGINAGNKPITNVADGVNGKDAVNKSQLDKIGDNEIKLGGDNTTVTAGQKLSQTGGLKFNIKGANGIETSAAGTDVTVKLDAATRGKIDNAADKNLSNLTPAGTDKIKDTAAWKVKANSNAAETVKGGDEVVFKDGAGVTITQNGKEFTIAADTSKISKDTKISYTANGAAPKKEVSLADGFNFEDGTLTTASVDTAGKVKYDVKTTTLTSTDGKVTVPTTDGVATAKDVANAINNSGWKANAGGNVDGTSASTLVKAGDEVVFKAGDNLTVKQDLTAGKQEYTYKLNKDLTGLDSVTTKTITVPGAPGTNDVVIGKDGISAGNKVIKDVAPGVNGTDAVNKNQLDTATNNLINKGMNFSADDYDPATPNTTVSKKLGERLEIVGGADKTKLSNDNIGSVVDNTGKINVKLAKELTGLTSAEFKTPAGDKTVINGDGLTVTPVAPGAAPISVTKDGINAGNKTITNVAPGVNGTDAVNKNQLDQKIGDNKIKLGGDTGTTATQDLSQAGGLQFNVKGANGIETSAAGTDVTVKLDAATRGKIDNAADKNLSNLTPAGIDKIKDTAAWKVKANSNAAETVKGGDEVVFKDGAGVTITQNGKEFTIAADTSKISKDTKISYTANGAAPKKEVSLADGFNFEDGTLTTATVDTAGKVKYDVKTTTLTSTDGKVNTPAANNLVTANDVANAINNAGWKANAGGNVDGASTSTLVKAGDEVVFKAGDNLTVKQDLTAGKQEYTYKLNKDLTGLDSVTSKTITVPGAPGTNDVVIGKDGISAGNKVIKDVAPGVNGTDAVNKNQLDTTANNLIDKGMNFSADDYDPATANTTVSKKLGERLEIVGGADKTKLSDNNIGSVVDNTGKINVKLAKELKDLTSAEFKTPAGDKTVINGDGLTVSPATPTTSPISVTKDGISAGDKKVTNVAPGTISKTSTDAINGSQLYNLSSNTIQLGGDNASTTDKQTLDKSGGIKFDIVGANGITTEAKDGKVTVKVDSSTIGTNSKLKYTANGDAPKQEVTLADGLNFKNGNFTTATVGANGEVKYDTVTQGLSVSPDGKAGLPNPATPGATTPNGLVTAQDVADALNNVGWKATADSTGTGIKTGTPSAQLVKNGSTVSYVAGDNLTVAQDVTSGDHKYTYSLNKVLKDLTSAEFKTPAGDKTVINGDGLTVSPATPTTSPISVTKDGISAGDKKVTNVAPGTISKTSTDAINGSQLYNLASNTIQLGGDNASTTDKQTLDKSGGIKFDIVGANGITTEAKDGKVTVKVDSSTIGANSKLKYTANGDAPKQEVTLADGLNFKNGNFTTATVGANGEVKYDTVTQGLSVSPDGKAGLPNPATPGATTPNGLVTAQDVADALNNVGWKATADSTGTGIKTGTPSAQLVKNGSTVSYVAGDNLTVAQDVTSGDHKYTYSLNKVLKDLTSAEFKTPAGDKTVINGDGLTVSPATPTTSPISVTKDGISAGDKKVTNVAPGTISKTSTDAINGSQLYNLASNTIQLGGDNASTTDKQTLDKSGGIKFDIVGANGITTEAKDGKVTVKVDSSTIGANSKLKYTANGDAPKQEVTLADGLNFKNGNFTTATVGANGEVKYDTVTQTLSVSPDGKAGLPNPATPGATTPNGLVTAQDVADALNNVGWKATADSTGTGIKTGTPSAQLVKNGSTVSYVAGNNLTVAQAVDTNGNHKYTYSLNKDLKDLDSVTTKTITIPGAPGTNDVVIGKDGISAGNKVIKDVAPGVNGTDAVNKNQLDTATNNLIDKGMNFSADDYNAATPNTTISKKLGERLEIVGGADKTKLSDNNIGSVVDNTGKINIKLAKELKDLTSAEFKTPAGDKTVINGDGLTVSPATLGTAPISITKDGISAGDKKVTNVAPGTISSTSTDAINGSQFHKLATNTIQLGGDNASTTDKQTLDKTGGIKFDIVGANGITTEAKDGKVTVKVDSSTIGANTKLKYKSNSDAATAQEVKLSDGLDFKNGNFTTATVGANGEVKYDTVTQGLTVTDGKAGLPNPVTPGATTPNGLVTAQDVADALNNVGWKATADATGTGVKTGTPSAQLVKNGSTVSYVAGDNLTVAQDVTAGDHKYTYSLNKVLKDLTSAEFKTSAGDKTVINGDGLTVSPATPGTAPISITKDGISAGDKKVTNVAPGTISSTSTDAINGSQFHKLATNTVQLGGDNSTVTATQQLDKTGGIKFDIVGANGITTEAKDGKVTVKVDSSTIGANAKLSYTANGAAPKQEVTLANGLDFKNGNFTTATVGANGEVKYDTVTQGLTVTDGKAGLPNPATPGATTPNGLVTAQDVADALNNVGWKATADATGTGVKTGTPSAQLVKNGSTVSYVAGDNLTVAQDVTAGDHKYTYSLNKVLKDLTSAEFKTSAGDKTVINGDGLTVSPATPGTAPISITKDGISAGDKKVTNVAPGTISSTSTDAINGSQFHKLATNTVQLGGDNSTVTATQQLDKTGGIKFDIVGANGITTEAKDGKVTVKVDSSTIGANAKLSYTANGAAPKQEVTLANGLDFKNGNFTTATVGANGEVKYDTVTQGLTVTDGKAGLPNPATPGATTPNGLVTAQDVADALNNVGWKATASAVGTGVASGSPSAQLVKNGSTVSYVAGDNLTVVQDVTAGDHKYTYSLNKVLKDLTSAEFKTAAGDKTVINGDGLTVSPATPGTAPISITKDGISAGDKKVTNVAPGTISSTSTDAINGSQFHKLATNTIQLGGDKGATATQQLDKTGGIKFNIVGENGITTTATGDKVTVGVDTNTIGANIKLKYKSNSDAGTTQEVKLSDGLDFKNGNFTTATVGANGEVKYDTVTQGLSVSPDGKAGLPNPATPGATTPNGLVTAQDVADALNNVGWNATASAVGTGVASGTPSAQLVKNGSTVSYVAGDNLAVAQDVDASGNHKYTYSLNKQLKDLTSAEFVNPTSGNKTVVNGDGLTITPSTPGAKNISITKDGISAGDKKITDVADGDITPTSKDAINGSQLYKLASNTISLGGDNSTVTATQQLNKNGGIKFNIVGDNGIITEAKDDKVIVRVNPATIGSNITLKYAANGANGQTVKLSDGLNFQDGNFTKASVDTAGKVKYDTVTQAIAPTADGTAQVAPGSTPGLATSADVVNAINNSGWKATAGGNVTGTATPTVVKNGQEVEFNAGDNLKVKQTIDPTTGKQTYEYSLNKDLTGLNSAEFTNAAGDKTKITAGNTEYTNAAGDKTVVNAGGLTISSSTPGAKDISVTKDGISAGDKVIKNVAAGVNDTDAVNVSQLKDVDNKITNVNNTINKGLNFKGNTGATVNKQLGDTLEIVGEGTKADSEYSGQNLKVVEDGGKLVVKMDKNLKSDTVTADTVNTNSVTVGAPGKDGVITVKDANGKDGVSINGKDGSIGLNGKDGSSATISTVQGNPGIAGTPGTTMDRIQYTDKAGTPHQVATLDDGMKYGGDTGTVINKKLNQQVNVVGGITDTNKLSTKDNIGVVSDGSNNLKVRLAKDLDGLESVTVRDTSGNSTVVKGDGVTITSSSGDTVSLTDKGLDNGGNVITNVAAGKDGTDAVNVDQLNQTVSNVVNAAGDAIAHVNNKVDKLGDRVNKGLAGAAAMAGLEFMDIGINQATVAAAVGGYRGTHAVAVGVQAAPTENTRVNAKVSMTPGSRSETMYSVGASYRFNWR
ncbi:YadA-like family protein [Fusobacterium periodonticum]|nr:YadA-like family protein [Fusobacterium periodonticum]